MGDTKELSCSKKLAILLRKPPGIEARLISLQYCSEKNNAHDTKASRFKLQIKQICPEFIPWFAYI